MSTFKVNEDSVSELVKEHIAYCPGWHNLIIDTFARLVYLCKQFNMETIGVCQIKEKFGGLRLYLDFSPTVDDESESTMQVHILQDIIDTAEMRSGNVCQISGNYGRVRNVNGWMMCLSDEEYKKQMDKLGLKNEQS
jgi:hypothetical protein